MQYDNEQTNNENKDNSTLKAIAIGLGLGALNITCTAGAIVSGLSTAAVIVEIKNNSTYNNHFIASEEEVYDIYGPAPAFSENADDVTGFN